ncbi:MAG: response regulator [Thermotogaceae bacterium]|nr:response regulator [Thermotogaceae bacterium]
MAKILIVDDSQMTRNFHAYILRAANFQVIDAIDGADALEKIYRESDIDCVITDVNMPNMDGFTMIRKIRSEQTFSTLPIIIATTLDAANDKKEGFKAGANFYLVKPVKPSVLIESVRMAIGREC